MRYIYGYGFQHTQAWNFYHPDQPQPLVARERVPACVDALDVLLTIWIGQAMLDDDSAHVERQTKQREWRA